MINSVYNYMAVSQLSGRYSKPLSRNIVHERRELRQIYNNILNLNNRKPLYLIKLSEENQNHVLSVKNASIELHSVISEIKESEPSVFSYRKAFSDNEKIATAQITTDDYTRLPNPFELRVDSLACSQVNSSYPLYSNGVGPHEGTYQFAIDVEDTSYEFQFHIAYNARNQEIETKLADFINKTDIGIRAYVNKSDTSDRITLTLESEATGNTNGLIFRLRDKNTPDGSMGIVEYYDLNNVTRPPHNAHFEINGEPKESLSNSFTLNQALSIQLLSTSEQAFQIGYEPDVDRVLTSVNQFVTSYNNVIQIANKYPSKQHLSSKLIHDVSNSYRSYKNVIESCGFYQDEDGRLKMDSSLTMQSIKEGDMENLFTDSGFIPSLMRKLDSITINPMEYVDKTIVTYPNTSTPIIGKSYITSMYSGMMFNYYC